MTKIFKVSDIISKINLVNSAKELEEIHTSLFSKKGYFTEKMKELSLLSINEKKECGRTINDNKSQLLEAIAIKRLEINTSLLHQKLQLETIDLTLPVPSKNIGGLHPLSYVTEQSIAICAEMGFKLVLGPEIEEDWYNFTALNIPLSHPSRQEHDTFYMNDLDAKGNRKVLRTHTSNIQIRTMIKDKEELKKGNSIKIVSLGKTYRSDSDATHSPMFHQMEGLYVDKIENINIPLLKSTLVNFCKKFFDLKELPIRFRSSYFPFTSLSYEVDISCDKTSKQLIIGKGDSWLEILGCGIVHPNVLENCGISSKDFSGFAFGIGLERITMLKYGFKDLRAMYDGDIRWLRHNHFSTLKTPTVFGGLN